MYEPITRAETLENGFRTFNVVLRRAFGASKAAVSSSLVAALGHFWESFDKRPFDVQWVP